MKKILIGLLLLFGSVSTGEPVQSETLNTRELYYSETPDSMKLQLFTLTGVWLDSTATTARTGAASYDTAITISPDSSYKLVNEVWWPGEDSVQRITYYYYSTQAIYAEVKNLDAWSPVTDNDTLLPDMSTLATATIAAVTNTVSLAKADMGEISDSVLVDSSSYQGGAAGLDSGVVHNIVLTQLPAQQGGGRWDGGAGNGSDSLQTVYLDTTTGRVGGVEAVGVTIRNAAWARVAVLTTDGAGVALSTLIDGDTYYRLGYGPPGFVWPVDTFTKALGVGRDTVEGYYIVPDSGSVAGKVCAVTINVKDGSGSPVSGIKISRYLSRSNVTDSAGNAISNRRISDTTNASGQVTFNCIWSSYLIPATDWVFSGSPRQGGIREVVTIPRQASYTLDAGAQ